MHAAKKIRMGRILRSTSGRGLVVPIDHGLTLGPIAGIESVRRISRFIRNPAIEAVIAHKGIISQLGSRGLLAGRGVILHVNGMSSLAESPDDKELLTAVSMAPRIGADAVSLQLNFNGKNDATNLRRLGRVVDEAEVLGLPVLTMLYDKVQVDDVDQRARRLRHLLRATIELGTDLVKIGYDEALTKILADIREDVAVLVAGGPLSSQAEIFAQVSHALTAGAAGVCIGRNVFASEDPNGFLQSLAQIVHGRMEREESSAALL